MIKKHLLLVLTMVLLVVSCKKEEKIEPRIQLVTIESAKQWFNTQQIKLPKLLFEDLQGKLFSPHWDSAVNYVSDSVNHIYCYSVPLTETMQGQWYMNVAITPKGNNAEYVHFRRFATSTAALSGVLNYYTIFGSFKESEILKEGKVDYSSRDKAVEGSDMLAEDNPSCMDTRGYTLSCGGSGPGDGIAFSVTYSGPEIVVTASRPDPIVIGNLSDRGGSISTAGYNGGGEISYSGGSGSLVPMITISAASLLNARIINDNKPSIDPKKYVSCFNDGKIAKEYKITIYVDQPVEGKSDQFGVSSDVSKKDGIVLKIGNSNLDVGHSFVGFEKINTDGTKVMQIMGFYPSPESSGNSKGIIKDDSGHSYDVSYTITLGNKKEAFDNALSKVVSDYTNSQYVLTNLNFKQYNCTNAAVYWFNTAGGSLQITPRGNFNGTPGDFGQDLRKLSSANKITGTAPIGKGSCN